MRVRLLASSMVISCQCNEMRQKVMDMLLEEFEDVEKIDYNGHDILVPASKNINLYEVLLQLTCEFVSCPIIIE